MGARALLRFGKFRQGWGFAMRDALEDGLRRAMHLKRACDALTFFGKMYIYIPILKICNLRVYFFTCFTMTHFGTQVFAS